MSVVCEYCSQNLSSKNNLLKHQKQAKYCLKLQGKNLTKIFPCYMCGKELANKTDCSRHISTHTEFECGLFEDNRKLQERTAKLILENQHVQNESLTKDDVIRRLEKQVESLQRGMERVASKPTTTNTLNINNFTPLTNALMLENAQRLTEKHMLQEDGEGYANLAEDICKGNITCSDYARSILKWKNVDDTVTDPKGNKLWKLFCTGIKERNNEVFNELLPKVQLKMSSDPEIGFAEATRMADYRRDIRDGADGETSDLQRIVIERLCRLEKV